MRYAAQEGSFPASFCTKASSVTSHLCSHSTLKVVNHAHNHFKCKQHKHGNSDISQ